MTNCEHFRFLSSDGKTQLHACLWIPDEKIKFRAVLQIAHGVAEHIERYDDFARYLNEQGIVVAGHDHLGHGQSLPEGGTPVYFGEKDGWKHAVDDIHGLHLILSKRYKRLPQLIMGHSMGSFLTRSYLIRYPGEKQAAILKAEAEKQAAILKADGEAQAIMAVQKAMADSLALLNEKAPNDQVLKLKALEAMQKVADGKATKIIIPSELQGFAGLASGIAETVKETK